MLRLQPFPVRRGCAGGNRFFQAGRKNQHGGPGVGARKRILNAHRGFVGALHLPLTDAQGRRVWRPTLAGDSLCENEQIGQAKYRRQLRSGIKQNPYLNDVSIRHVSIQPLKMSISPLRNKRHVGR